MIPGSSAREDSTSAFGTPPIRRRVTIRWLICNRSRYSAMRSRISTLSPMMHQSSTPVPGASRPVPMADRWT